MHLFLSIVNFQVPGRKGPSEGDLHPLHLRHRHNQHTGLTNSDFTVDLTFFFSVRVRCSHGRDYQE